MKYAVLYQSQSGNTEMIAKAIYDALQTESKTIVNIDMSRELPDAAFYFIGFPVHNTNCSMDIVELFEKIPASKLAVFATCGFIPTEKYHEKIERNIELWLPENAEYKGFFMCHGSVENDQRAVIFSQMPQQKEFLSQMFQIGAAHPDKEDLDAAVHFARTMQREEDEIRIHID